MAKKRNLKTALVMSVFLLGICCTTVAGKTIYVNTPDGPYAKNPNPADGSEIDGERYFDNIYAQLDFTPGDGAVSHEAFFSDDEAKVTARDPCVSLGEPGAPPTTYYVGLPLSQFTPYTDSLVRGMWYYWCVDETDSNNVTWEGSIWNFYIALAKASDPTPPDGQRFVSLTPTLSWGAGVSEVYGGPHKHDIYFGTSETAVTNADRSSHEYMGNQLFGDETWDPNAVEGLPPLDYWTDYYWRIDEVHSMAPVEEVIPGDVWKFTTKREGRGVRGEYYRWNWNTGDPMTPTREIAFDDANLVLTRLDPEINFDWGGGSPDPCFAVPPSPNDYFACRWVGQVEACWSETYTFTTRTDEGARLWIGGQLLVDKWRQQGATRWSGTIDLVASATYSLTMEHYEHGGDASAQLLWSSPSTPEEIVPSGALDLPYMAYLPDPANGDHLVDPAEFVECTWASGDNAAQHKVYWGTDPNNLVLVRTKPRAEPNYDPGHLDFESTYYWRVVEVNGVNVWTGNLWTFSTVREAGTLYVDADATGANNGTSWADAYNYLQEALAMANLYPSLVDEIRVAAGTYHPDANSSNPGGTGERTATFELVSDVGVYGGYQAGGTWLRDPDTYETILSGDLNGDDGLDFANNGENSYHVVTGSGTNANTVLDGFTITAGNANGSYPYNRGAGMYNISSNPTVTNCMFTANSAFDGGGMFNLASSPTVTNCTFTANSATYAGGGIGNQFSSSSPTVTSCTFSGNRAQHGSGMFNRDNSSPTLTNCTFSGNSAAIAGGGMYNWEGSPTVTNCTFSGNSAGYSGGGGMYNSGGSPTVANCILWGNTAASGAQIYNDGTSLATVSYSDIQGGYSGTSNINADPLFADADLRLSPGSPCIDAGDNAAVPLEVTTDLDGHPRIIDGDCNGTIIVDMGAYEFNYAYIGDFDGECDVDFADFAILGLAWLTEPGQTGWNPFCDISIPADNKTDWADVKVLSDNWLAGL